MKLPVLMKPFILSFLFSLSILLLYFLISSRSLSPPSPPHHIKTTTTTTTSSAGIRIRPGIHSYESYIQLQLNKTLNPKLRQLWKTRDWDRKVRVFSSFFLSLQQRRLLYNSSRALSIGARVGQEVQALRRVGVNDSIGIDLVPSPPLVLKGDFHDQPFPNSTFDFEFSNVFDHALYPERFVREIERTLKPGGVCVLHVSISKRADKYSANDLFSVGPLVDLFTKSDLLGVRRVDGFGLDTEVVLRKRRNDKGTTTDKAKRSVQN